MSKHFCVNAVVSSLLRDYVVQPDYSEKREEIEAHEFVRLRQEGLNPRTGKEFLPTWHKVLFTTSDCVIVQEVELTWSLTRFKVRKIPMEDWNKTFVEWIDADHERFWEVEDCWDKGMRQYGAAL